MEKKLLFLTSALFSAFLVAQEYKKPQYLIPIEKKLTENFKNKVEIISSSPISKALTLAVIETGGERGALIIENDTGRIFNLDGLLYEPKNEIVDLLRKTKKEITAYNAFRTENVIFSGIQANPKIAFSLGNTKGKPTKYIVLDPNCSYCKDKVDKIEKEMAKNNLKIMVVGLLSSNSMAKSEFFYNRIGKMKTDEEKVALLRKIFDRNLVVSKSETINETAIEATKVFRKAGAEGVPFSFVR